MSTMAVHAYENPPSHVRADVVFCESGSGPESPYGRQCDTPSEGGRVQRQGC